MSAVLRYLLVALACLAGLPGNASADGRYNVGWVYKSFMVVYKDGSGDPLYRIPIPAGDWKLIAENLEREQSGRRVQRLILARAADNTISALLEVRASVENNHSRRWEEEPCRKDSIFENNYGTSLWTQRCLAITTRPVVRFSADDTGRRAIGYLSSNSLSLPRNPVQVTATQFGDRGKFLAVSLTLFPRHYGFDETPAADVADHPWGHQVAMLDPARKRFLDRLKGYAEDFGALVYRAYRDEDLTAYTVPEFRLPQEDAKPAALADARAASGQAKPGVAAPASGSTAPSAGEPLVPGRALASMTAAPVAAIAQPPAAVASPAISAALGAPATPFRYERFSAATVADSVAETLPAPAPLASASAGNPAAATRSGARRALLLGNNDYRFVGALSNAKADATSLAAVLNDMAYQTTLKLDVDALAFKAALRAFKNSVEPGDEVVIYYAGHGVQLGATNFLLPVDVGGESEEQIRDDAIPLQRILDDMAERKAKLTLAIVDACRDNPFQGTGRTIGSTRGLAPTSAATGQMVVYAAGTGQKSIDRLGPADTSRNGLFTRVLLREMQRKDLTVDRVIKRVRQEVADLARRHGHDQVPAIYDQVLGDFFFAR